MSDQRWLRPAFALACALFPVVARGQTAPLVPPPQAAPTRDEVEQAKSKIQKMYEEFLLWKAKLPFTLGAGAYIYYYQPVDYTTFAPTDRTGQLEVYAFYLKLDSEWHGLGGHLEMRFRDGGHLSTGAGNDYLRPYFTSNVWFQELYAYYQPRPWFRIRAGKMYRNVGILWDDSFFGNLLYMDGLKLNPDWGVGIDGTWENANGSFALTYSMQYILNTDGVQGGVTYARGIGPEPGTLGYEPRTYGPDPEGELDSGGHRQTQQRKLFTGRVAATIRPVKWVAVTAGVSGLTGEVRRSSAVDNVHINGRGSNVAADLTLAIGHLTVFGEYQRQLGDAVRSADYAWVGARYSWKGLQIRMSTSYVHYAVMPVVQEYMLVPGVQYTIGPLTILLEYDEWRRKDPRVSQAWQKYDRSLNAVLALGF